MGGEERERVLMGEERERQRVANNQLLAYTFFRKLVVVANLM